MYDDTASLESISKDQIMIRYLEMIIKISSGKTKKIVM